MASISLVVKVTITKGTRAVSLPAFSIPAILGPSNRIGSDPYRIYTDPADMLTDGFLTTDPEYVHAVKLTSQVIVPDQFVVSKFTAPVIQIDTITPTAVDNTHYIVTIAGVAYDYLSDGSALVSEIVAGLIALINADTAAPVIASGSTTLILTGKVAGGGFATTVNANMALVHTTANHSIVDDIQTLQATNVAFYGLLVTSKADADIEQVAAYVESQLLVYVAASSTAGILTSSTTDIASVLAGLNYTRTALLYSAIATSGPDAAWMGYMLPTTPGSSNWKFKQLAGVTADNLTATQITNAQGKKCNLYITIGGVGTTLDGVVSSGEYLDVTIFLDWLKARMQQNVFGVLVDPNNLKVPFTNKGISTIENPMRQTLQEGQDNGGLASGWTVTSPDVKNIVPQDKQARDLKGMRFDAELAGAINKVEIQGFVSV